MTDETELTAEERAESPDDATIAEWMIESQQDMPVIVASVMALHGRLMSALREVCRLREEAHERERDLTCAEWNVESNARAIKSIAAELAAERARTPATSAPSVTAARHEERCMAVGYGQQCVGRAGHSAPHEAPGRDGGMWVGYIGPAAATAEPEIPFAAQREAELRATERPAPRPTR